VIGYCRPEREITDEVAAFPGIPRLLGAQVSRSPSVLATRQQPGALAPYWALAPSLNVMLLRGRFRLLDAQPSQSGVSSLQFYTLLSETMSLLKWADCMSAQKDASYGRTIPYLQRTIMLIFLDFCSLRAR
jgi:hypothetical protein